MGLLENRTPLCIVNAVLAGVTLLFCIIAVATEFWFDIGGGTNSGLFRTCISGTCNSINYSGIGALGLIVPVSAIFTVIVLVLVAIELTVNIFKPSKHLVNLAIAGFFFAWFSWTIMLGIFSLFLVLLGLAVQYGWSYYIACIVDVMALIGFVMGIIDVCTMKSNTTGAVIIPVNNGGHAMMHTHTNNGPTVIYTNTPGTPARAMQPMTQPGQPITSVEY